MSRGRRLFWALLAAALAFVPGCIGGMMFSQALPRPIESVPLPHHVPKSPSAASFRFAMAHDVIHERYPKHGPAFYRERERKARERLKQIPPDSDEAFGLYDDIGVGLDRLGKPADAIPILRHKLELQQKRGLTGRDLYTTYANLGTFIVHTNMPKAITGAADAKAAVCEGLELVRKSVGVHPEAHFGRELWQVKLGEFLIAATTDCRPLTNSDFVGDQLDIDAAGIQQLSLASSGYMESTDFGRASDFGWGAKFAASPRNASDFLGEWKRIRRDPEKLPAIWDDVKEFRNNITKVGPDSAAQRVPFDEPMLGIIGMWRQGGGANPHFCLATGEIMLRVGQRRIAWTAYERARLLVSKFWPKPEIQQALRDHCNHRQKEIEATLPADEVAALRPNFNDELAFGLNYQREYQDYEAAKIAAGADIADEQLFDQFHKTHEPIASPTGPEEWYVFERDNLGTRIQIGLAGGFMISGLAAFLAALWLRWRRRPKVALDISSEGFGVTVYRDANEPKHNKTNASR